MNLCQLTIQGFLFGNSRALCFLKFTGNTVFENSLAVERKNSENCFSLRQLKFTVITGYGSSLAVEIRWLRHYFELGSKSWQRRRSRGQYFTFAGVKLTNRGSIRTIFFAYASISLGSARSLGLGLQSTAIFS